MTEHTCHALGCTRYVQPAKFMCKPHWFTLPKPLRDRIWLTYRVGQEDDKRPSAAYLAVAREAIHWLHAHDGVPVSDRCVVCLERGAAPLAAATTSSERER